MNLMIATEDELSEAVIERLVRDSATPWMITVRMRENGNGYLRRKLEGLLRTANRVPVCLLTDLDRMPCPPGLIRDWLGGRALPAEMRFRVAVREVEAWLLADREGLSNFLGIAEDRLPEIPEILDDPKRELLNLVKKFGSRALKAELLPAFNARAKVGLGYNATLSAFVRDAWNPQRAASRSESLARAMMRL